MTVVSNAQWRSGATLLESPPEDRATAVLAIKNNENGSFFVLPEIFTYDKKQRNFIAEQHDMPSNEDYWFMLEEELLFSLEFMSVNESDFAVETTKAGSQTLYS